MVANRLNIIIFPYYLSGFLSAFRSVTFYMQKQHAHDAQFKSWYPQKQVEMAADPVLKMLNAHRTGVVHCEPIDLFFYRDFEFPARFGNCIETKHLEFTYDQTSAGEAKTRIKVDADGVEEEVVSRISWRFTEEDKVDVVQHCYLGLQKLDLILRDLESMCAPTSSQSQPPAA
jgi:hypothetical protein